jgi:scavenger receptor class B protein 1
MKMKVMDLLFYGLPIDCNVQDFPGTAVCSMLKDSPDLLKGGENIYKFSLFGTVSRKITISR